MSTRIMLLGAKGMLAYAFSKTISLMPQYKLFSYDKSQLDITNYELLENTIFNIKPEIIINCAAYTSVDGCESETNPAYKINSDAVGAIARYGRAINSIIVHFSTDYLFDGKKNKSAYKEDDEAQPLNIYGLSKLIGEEYLKLFTNRYYIIRASWLYGENGKNFVDTMIELFKSKDEVNVVSDQKGSPTYSFDLAKMVMELLTTNAFGTYNYSNLGECSWYDFAVKIHLELMEIGIDTSVKHILPVSTKQFPRKARRPEYSVLDKSKIMNAIKINIPHWHESLHEYIIKKVGI